MTVTELYSSLGLTHEEYEEILKLLGRTPTHPELALYSVMWSEHCSYKSSSKHLTTLPTKADWVVAGPGENAGVVETPCGVWIAFKIESHNHPSAVEPFQGAATGVGGIVRDILSLGARPIALMDSLRFGPLSDARNRFLFDGVVKGIAAYGNSLGLAVVGGEAVFDDCYTANPLVNVVCIGIVEDKEILRSAATAAGQAALLYGSPTGRDGIGGASVLASKEFSDDDDSKRPSVQVGDPFTEKLLIEATLEMKQRGLIAGIQDLGAAGISCAISETAAAGALGIDVDLDKVFLREPSMEAWEICMSESQERMLAAIDPSKVAEAIETCAKWGLQSAVIGTYQNGGRVVAHSKGEVCIDVDAKSVAEGPSYSRPFELSNRDELLNVDVASFEWPHAGEILLKCLASPSVASKAWVWRQYDHMVRLNGVCLPPTDAAMLCIPERTPDGAGIAISVDGSGRRCMLDPYGGAAGAVAESARNVAVTGAIPLAVTNCLNFGSPEREDVMGDFVEVVRGIADACSAFGIPVTGGNVSFYNEAPTGPIFPTPVVGVLGYIEKVAEARSLAPCDDDALVLLGVTTDELGGSEALAVCFSQAVGRPPRVDLAAEVALCKLLTNLPQATSAHDISEGGIAVALAEMCIASGIGATVFPVEMNLTGWLFSEGGARAVIGCAKGDVSAVVSAAAHYGVTAVEIGVVGGSRLTVEGTAAEGLAVEDGLDLSVDEMTQTWTGSIPTIMETT